MDDGNRHIAFICSKGNLDMAYPALVMGWAALGNGIDVTIFFTFWGLDIINKNRVDHLELAPVANTSMKMSMMGVDTGNLGIPNIMGVLPGMTAFATKLMKNKMTGIEVPSVREYLQMLVDAGAKLYACKMSVDMMELKMDDFVDGVIDIVTAGDFMDMTEGAGSSLFEYSRCLIIESVYLTHALDCVYWTGCLLQCLAVFLFMLDSGGVTDSAGSLLLIGLGFFFLLLAVTQFWRNSCRPASSFPKLVRRPGPNIRTTTNNMTKSSGRPISIISLAP
jgi:peroxiredoxin family protein